MDEQVKAALAKWPDVPDCTGWLALDARGRWRVGDAKSGPRQTISHAAMIAFINRNYAAHGRYWIFQNGPQRVYVELEYTPFVWRLVPNEQHAWDLMSQLGTKVEPTSLWLDSDGRFLLETRVGHEAPIIGVIHDHDTAILAEMLRDPDGALLDDETLSLLSTGGGADLAAAQLPTASLDWDVPATSTTIKLPLRRIASHQVATRFGFEPKPAVALRVDVDTRR